MVKAVASGVPSLAPFFDENSGLGHDAQVRSQPAHGSSLQQGSTPGLYGGTKRPTVCDVDRLKQFLTDPGNNRKAHEWARVVDIPQSGISAYLDRLTPVLLRHDTLVKNHDYKKEKAVPFDALLQAGIAVLVDEAGVPAVKCSCGNPLRPFKGATNRISVEFEDGNKKWRDYDADEVVLVRPAPGKVDRFALVDVDEPERGIYRRTGTRGEADKVFDTRERHQVPRLAGTTFGAASSHLTNLGLATAYDSAGLPPSGAIVTGSDPGPGAALPFGSYVTLNVRIDSGSPDDGSGGSRGTTPSGTGSGSEPGSGSVSGSAPGVGGSSAPGSDTPSPDGTDSSTPSTAPSTTPPSSSDKPTPSASEPPSPDPTPPDSSTPDTGPTSEAPSSEPPPSPPSNNTPSSDPPAGLPPDPPPSEASSPPATATA
ncbi:PASTA domain-containing protein [Streptomyces sp. WI04-05B]|uniref:PASTA domain-containing protein n=1 Tax=Streptomyces TaxID=1883 RepID=UPI00299FE842|nr:MULTISPECIES: PASTA domain-containing protein [unclassified Streptomyces]MDX2547695.1 PASTA domain-containing protein [Streptomyces sp. WI04-05B]MDX2590008.1 PASTA domain-containing protein [Streptomyces sp. WI04-05A]MDX3748050.1 PASTA domain-containing protein [Streptomyces sp. AK08-02]